MAPRKSSRPRKPVDQEPPDQVQHPPSQAEKGEERKAPKEQKAAKIAGRSGEAKKYTTKVATRPASGTAGSRDMHRPDMLSSLSPEILGMIADNINDRPTISVLSRTSKRFYALMTPRLYNRVAVAAMFHAHIAKLIRTLEPHLTIKQKKQLKKEGKYKGQQEKYPTGLDEKKIPNCAGYVRQLIIGASDPGKKHRYIVDRYYEEVLKNMPNLTIVETCIATKSICEGIASFDRLKALSISLYDTESGNAAPLTRIKHLKHLRLYIRDDAILTAQSMIRNSMSTLQSLDITLYSGYEHIFRNWKKNLELGGHDTASRADEGPDLSVLRSLHIQGMMIDEVFVEEFPRAIELAKLRELNLVHLKDPQNLMWPFLTSLNSSYKRSKTPLNLRTLLIDMRDSSRQNQFEEEKAEFAAKCQYIASFDTLRTLKIPDYGEYSDSVTTNPGLSNMLLQAILKHKDLTTLKISYTGITCGYRVPYLGAKTVGDIIDGLPHLQELDFAPDESEIDEISRVLSRGKNLESITCFPYESWAERTGDPEGGNILSSILSNFMSNAKAETDGTKFVWEDYYKLNQVRTTYPGWAVASKFGKREKGPGRPKKVQVDVDGGTREVWHQHLPPTQFVHVGYDPLFEWVVRVEKQI